MRGGTLLILGQGVKGQGQPPPLARGCHALRCLVLNSKVPCIFCMPLTPHPNLTYAEI